MRTQIITAIFFMVSSLGFAQVPVGAPAALDITTGSNLFLPPAKTDGIVVTSEDIRVITRRSNARSQDLKTFGANLGLDFHPQFPREFLNSCNEGKSLNCLQTNVLPPAANDVSSALVLRDCHCKSGPENVHDMLLEAQQLKATCDCYKQQSSLPGYTISNEEASQTEESKNKLYERSVSNMSNLMSYMYYGSSAQALFMDDGQNRLGRKYAMPDAKFVASAKTHDATVNGKDDGDKVVREALTLGLSHIASAGTGAAIGLGMKMASTHKNKPEIRSPTAESFQPLLEDTPEGLTANSCISLKHYFTYKQVPKEVDFYKDLDSMAEDKFDVQDWDVASLFGQLKNAIDSATASNVSSYDDPFVNKLKNRIKFLFANPLYAKVFASDVNGSLPIKQNLFREMKKNFSCQSVDRLECAVKQSKKKAEMDAKFFADNGVKNIVERSTQTTLVNWISGVLDDPGLYAYRPVLPSVTLRHEAGDLNAELISNACSRVSVYISARNEPVPAGKKRDPSDYSVAEFTNQLAEQFNFDKANNDDFQNLNEYVCRSKHCPTGKPNCADNEQMNLSDYMASKKRDCSKKSGVESDKCWMDVQGDFLKNYAEVKSSNFKSSFTDIDVEGKRYLSYLRNASPDKATAMSRQETKAALAEKRVLDGPALAYNPSTTSSGGMGGQFGSSSSGSGFSVVNREPVTLAQLNSRSSSADVPMVSAVSGTSPVTAAPGVQGSEVAAPTALINPNGINGQVFASAVAPTPQMAAISRDLENARNESSEVNAQASALASAMATSTDPSARSGFDAQIQALIARADAADARAKSLEEQLKASEAKARDQQSGRSVASSAVENIPATATPKTTSTVSSNVGSAVANNSVGSNSIVPLQTFGSGSNSVSVPVSLPAAASTRGPSKGSSGVNFNFKYANDAKVSTGGSSGAGIIVSGASSAFDATADLATAVNASPAVDIGNVSADISSRLSAKDLPTISQYADVIRAQPGSIIRVTYSTPQGGARELVVGKAADGTLFFPEVRNLAVRRLQQLNATLSSR